jgi:tetratricopeptide (TPR) repeat protein
MDRAARWLVTLACVVLSVSAAGAQEPDYQSMFALRSSDGFRRALAAADAQLSADSRNGTAAGVRALVYANAVDFLAMGFAEAREAKRAALARAIELAPKNPWTRAAYGLIHLTDDPLGAERELAMCIDEHPDFIECYNLYGDLLRKTGRAEQAGGVYRPAMQRWPGDGELIVSYSLFLQETGKLDEALALLEKLTNEQPGFARGHWHLAVMRHESKGDRALALREAKRALDLDPLIWNGGKFLETLGRVPQSR